jgi:uncharacterized protein (TIGR03435 family)
MNAMPTTLPGWFAEPERPVARGLKVLRLLQLGFATLPKPASGLRRAGLSAPFCTRDLQHAKPFVYWLRETSAGSAGQRIVASHGGRIHRMRHVFSVFILAATTLASALFAQDSRTPKMMAPDARPQFEVATVKPSQSSEAGGTIQVSPSGMVNLTNFPVMTLLQFSYNVLRRQISGGPSWLESERFDIVGKPDMEGSPNMSQVREMLQKLLADRLHLSVHHEKKDLSGYGLLVAKGGPKLTEDTDNRNGMPTFLGSGGLQGRNIRNATMAEFANDLQGRLGRPVVDQTGLGPKRYDIILKWTPDALATNGATGPPRSAATPDDGPPDIFAAIQQQLGLKLESTEAQVDVIIIDHAEKPDEN